MTARKKTGIPDARTCEQARLSHDARFDGLFFTAATGTYCRPVCPQPSVEREDIRYYSSAAAAERDGFSPCLHCRPELAPAWRCSDAPIARALALIQQGFLSNHSAARLATRLNLSTHQLNHLFKTHLGASPRQVHGTRRRLNARQLLVDTQLPLTQIALATGFNGVHRFKSCFMDVYGVDPRDLRPKPVERIGAVMTLRLDYRPPFHFQPILDFLRRRALYAVEVVTDNCYSRTFGTPEAPGWLRLTEAPGDQPTLLLQLDCPDFMRIPDMINRVRRMFDLDAEPAVICGALSADPEVYPLVDQQPGLRLPGAWSEVELILFKILHQHYDLATCRDLLGRIIRTCGTRLDQRVMSGLEALFPGPECLTTAGLKAAGLSPQSIRAVLDIIDAMSGGRIDFSPGQTLEEFIARWQAIPCVSPATAHYFALRALGHPDAFPGYNPQDFEHLRPWRGYAWTHLKGFHYY